VRGEGVDGPDLDPVELGEHVEAAPAGGRRVAEELEPTLELLDPLARDEPREPRAEPVAHLVGGAHRERERQEPRGLGTRREEATREAFLAHLVHGRVAAQVLVDELEDRLRGDGSANAVTRRNRGGKRQVERRLELLAAARLGGERGLPVVVEASLVVDDAQPPGAAVPVDAIELAAQLERSDPSRGAFLEPDGLPVAERGEVEGGEGRDGAYHLGETRREDA